MRVKRLRWRTARKKGKPIEALKVVEPASDRLYPLRYACVCPVCGVKLYSRTIYPPPQESAVRTMQCRKCKSIVVVEEV